MRNPFELPLRGTITLPSLVTNAPDGGFDWGTVPLGWVVPKQLELRNNGYGAITVSSIGLAGGNGTSPLLSFSGLPALPLTLERGETAQFDINLRAQTMWNGALPSIAIRAENPTPHNLIVPLRAAVRSCLDSCSIVNGTAACNATTQTCSIGACFNSPAQGTWYDNDGEPSTGCECREIDPNGDPNGDGCAEGVDMGNFRDGDGRSATYTGIIHATYPSGTRIDDVDYISFYAEDASQVFGEDYDVRIDLTSADPGIFMCVSRRDSASYLPVSECGGSESCGLRTFRRDGSYGSEDGARYTIKVYRTASSTPSCTPYTVSMRNG